MNRNIVLCGVGGQGTVLASKLIAAAAMNKNLPVMSAETGVYSAMSDTDTTSLPQ